MTETKTEPNIIAKIQGIKCDNESCDYNDKTIKVEQYESYINKPCPKCGEVLLTQEHYDLTQYMLAVTDIINQIPVPPDLDKNMSDSEKDEYRKKQFKLMIDLKKDGMDISVTKI